MKIRDLPPVEFLRECFAYYADTGLLAWKQRPAHHFKPGRWGQAGQVAGAFNARHAGRSITTTDRGYISVTINGVRYRAHRIIWLLYTGGPLGEIDHINGDRSDNRIANLRSVTHAENCKNAARRSDNSSTAIGVYFDSRRKKWAASISVDGVGKFLGRFDSIDEAKQVRGEAALAASFHENHGRASSL